MIFQKIIFNQLIFFFSFFIKVKKKKILISLLKGGGGSSNPENAYFLCKYFEYKKIDYSYVSDVKINGLNSKPVKLFTFNYFLTCLKSQIIIFENDLHNDLPGYRSRGTYKINLFHGLALKKIYLLSKFTKKIFSRNILNYFRKLVAGFCFTDEYNLIVTSNETHKSIYKKSFNNKNVEVIGQPRNDFLINCNKKKIREKILKKLKIKNFNGKIITYLPTFRDTKKNMNNNLDNKEIENFLVKNNCILLSKNHFFYENNYKNYLIRKKNTNIFNLRNEFLTQEILVVSDILITDYSGIYFDFLLLNKPIIFYAYDYKKYIKANRDINFNYFDSSVTPGPKVYNIKSLILELKKKLLNNSDIKKINLAKDKFHYYKDGKNCERLLRYISRIIK